MFGNLLQCDAQSPQQLDPANRSARMQKRLNLELNGLARREDFHSRIDKSGIAFGTFLNEGWDGKVERVGIPGLRTEGQQECGGKITGYLPEGRALSLPADDPTTGYSRVEIEMSRFSAVPNLKKDFQEECDHRLSQHERNKRPGTPAHSNESAMLYERTWDGPGESGSVLYMSTPQRSTAEVRFIHGSWLMRALVHRSIARTGDPKQAARLAEAKSELLRYADEMVQIAKRVEELVDLPDAVIFLPGICGSWLKENGGSLLWPAGQELGRYGKLRMRPDGTSLFDIRSDGLLRKEFQHVVPRGPIDVYGPFLDSLEPHGFHEGINLFPFDYDWRLSCAAHVPDLEKLVRQAAEGSPNGRVTLIGHSMGGLVARAFVLSKSPSATLVSRIITLGTPYGGSPKAFAALAEGYNFDNPLASDFEMKQLTQNTPGAYELLPDRSFLWNATRGDAFSPEDLAGLIYPGLGESSPDSRTIGHVATPYPLRETLQAAVQGTIDERTPRAALLCRNTQHLAMLMSTMPPMTGSGLSVGYDVHTGPGTIRDLFRDPPSHGGDAGGTPAVHPRLVALRDTLAKVNLELRQSNQPELTLFETTTIAESVGFPRLLFWNLNPQLERQRREFQQRYGRSADSKMLPATYTILGHRVPTIVGFTLWPLEDYLKLTGKDAADVQTVYRTTRSGQTLAEPETLVLCPVWGDGDGTVPLNGALLSTAARQYFVTSGGDDPSDRSASAQHSHLPTNRVVQDIVRAILANEPPPEDQYPYRPARGLPPLSETGDENSTSPALHQVQITLRSDAHLRVTDLSGRIAGRNTDGTIERSLPQGDFLRLGGAEYVAISNLDQDIQTTVTGFREGRFTLDIEIHRRGQPIGAFAYVGVPVVDGTVAAIRFVPNHLDANVPDLVVTSPQGENSRVSATIRTAPTPEYDRTWMLWTAMAITGGTAAIAAGLWLRYRVWPRLYHTAQSQWNVLRSRTQRSRVLVGAACAITGLVRGIAVTGHWFWRTLQNLRAGQVASQRERWIALGLKAIEDSTLPIQAERARLHEVSKELATVKRQLADPLAKNRATLQTRQRLLKSQQDSLLIQIGRIAETQSRRSRA